MPPAEPDPRPSLPVALRHPAHQASWSGCDPCHRVTLTQAPGGQDEGSSGFSNPHFPARDPEKPLLLLQQGREARADGPRGGGTPGMRPSSGVAVPAPGTGERGLSSSLPGPEERQTREKSLCRQLGSPFWEAEACLPNPSQTRSQVCSGEGMMPQSSIPCASIRAGGRVRSHQGLAQPKATCKQPCTCAVH